MFSARAILGFLFMFVVLRNLNPQGIIIYQGVALGVLVSVVQFALARFLKRSTRSVALKDAMITLLLIYDFVFTVPATADRSYTVRMLRHLAGAPRGLSRDDIGQFYVVDFVDRGGIDKRLMEQQASGTIVQRNGVYFLTPTGKAINNTFRWTCYAFSCEGVEN